jgi:hypothetical protein
MRFMPSGASAHEKPSSSLWRNHKFSQVGSADFRTKDYSWIPRVHAHCDSIALRTGSQPPGGLTTPEPRDVLTASSDGALRTPRSSDQQRLGDPLKR